MTRLNNIKANSKVDFYIQKLSDLLRLNILAEHGGVWFDISTILLEDLTWL